MFVLKKLISQLFYPVPLCLGLFIVGLMLLFFTRKQKAGKLIISMGAVLFTVLSYTAIPDMLLSPLEYQYSPLNLSTTADARNDKSISSVRWIVVLGGGHIYDPKIPITSQVSGASLVRLIEAIRLYKKIPGSKLILSGGKVFELTSEAETMAEIAKSIGVDQEDLLLESDSKDTVDQARLIKPMVGDDEFILVTSAAHMPRSMAMFEKLGMYPIPAPAGHLTNESQNTNPDAFFPGPEGFYRMECAFHEYLGYIWAKLRGQI